MLKFDFMYKLKFQKQRVKLYYIIVVTCLYSSNIVKVETH